MKHIKFLATTALVASILGGATFASAAEVQDVTTNGDITFTPDNEDGTEVIPPEELPDVDIPPIGGEDNTGPLTIAYAPSMSFGTQKISNKDQTYDMVAEKQAKADGTGKVPYVSFAQVQDKRGTNDGWDLKVSLSKFESGTQNNELKGAEITLSQQNLKYEGNDSTLAPSVHGSDVVLKPGAGASPVMTAAKSKGAGVSSVVWGDQKSLDDQAANPDVEEVKNDAISLFVPGSTAKDAAKYQSTLKWELAATPGN